MSIDCDRDRGKHVKGAGRVEVTKCERGRVGEGPTDLYGLEVVGYPSGGGGVGRLPQTPDSCRSHAGTQAHGASSRADQTEGRKNIQHN